jgi:hypothetical protein
MIKTRRLTTLRQPPGGGRAPLYRGTGIERFRAASFDLVPPMVGIGGRNKHRAHHRFIVQMSLLPQT